MQLSIKLILSSLAILATATDIHTQEIQELEGSQQLLVTKLYRGMVLLWGSGVEQSQLPIIVYSVRSTITLDVNVYIRKKKCNFKFLTRNVTPDVQAIKQLGDNTVVLVWTKLALTHGKSTLVTTISILDMEYCDKKKDLEVAWDVPDNDLLEVVPFVDGFDVITSQNSRASYDTDGNLTGETKSFPINSFDFSISPVSATSPTNGFFVADYVHTVLNLVKVDGTVKRLLEPIPTKVFSNNEQSLYSVCLLDVNVVSCYQYGEDGNEKWRNKTNLGFSGVLDVKNLVGGGLAFATLNTAKNQLYVVEMAPNEQVNTWNYFPKKKFSRVRLMEFNKNDHTFVLAYEASQVEQRQVFDETIALQKYSLV